MHIMHIIHPHTHTQNIRTCIYKYMHIYKYTHERNQSCLPLTSCAANAQNTTTRVCDAHTNTYTPLPRPAFCACVAHGARGRHDQFQSYVYTHTHTHTHTHAHTQTHTHIHTIRYGILRTCCGWRTRQARSIRVMAGFVNTLWRLMTSYRSSTIVALKSMLQPFAAITRRVAVYIRVHAHRYTHTHIHRHIHVCMYYRGFEEHTLTFCS